MGEHPFSCIPNVFFPDGRRPHRNWVYIREAAHQMFEAWEREQSAPSAKKRKSGKRRSASAAEEEQQVEEEEEVEQVPVEDEQFIEEEEMQSPVADFQEDAPAEFEEG